MRSNCQACIKAQQDDSIVKASINEGEHLGVNATPTLFINGEKMDGALPIDELRAVLDRALVQAGVQPPPVHPAAIPAGAAQSGSKQSETDAGLDRAADPLAMRRT